MLMNVMRAFASCNSSKSSRFSQNIGNFYRAFPVKLIMIIGNSEILLRFIKFHAEIRTSNVRRYSRNPIWDCDILFHCVTYLLLLFFSLLFLFQFLLRNREMDNVFTKLTQYIHFKLTLSFNYISSSVSSEFIVICCSTREIKFHTALRQQMHLRRCTSCTQHIECLSLLFVARNSISREQDKLEWKI